MQIRMTSAHNGYAAGDVLNVGEQHAGESGCIDSGTADAFVEWARVAVYVPEAKSVEAPPADKMMDSTRLRRKAGRPAQVK